MVDLVFEYYQRLPEMPVVSRAQPGFLRHAVPASAPEGGEELEAVLEDVR